MLWCARIVGLMTGELVAARTKILRKYWFRIEEKKVDPWNTQDLDVPGEYHCLELANGNWAFRRGL